MICSFNLEVYRIADICVCSGVCINTVLSTGTDFVTTDIPDGVLNSVDRSQNITIETKSNDIVQDNRNFTVIIEHVSENSPLVKLQSGSGQAMSVIIVDDDIGT